MYIHLVEEGSNVDSSQAKPDWMERRVLGLVLQLSVCKANMN